MLGAVAGIGEQAHPVGLGAVGDPHLAAIDDVIVAIGSRIRFDLGDVGARARLRDADAGDRLAGDRRGKELAAQSVRAVAGERRRGHVGLHPDRRRNRAAADRAKFLRHHRAYE